MNARRRPTPLPNEKFWADPLGIEQARAWARLTLSTQRWTASALFVVATATLLPTPFVSGPTFLGGSIMVWVLAVPFLLGAIKGLRALDLLGILGAIAASIAIAILAGRGFEGGDMRGWAWLLPIMLTATPFAVLSHLAGVAAHRVGTRIVNLLTSDRGAPR